MEKKQLLKKEHTKLTPKEDTKPAIVKVDDSMRLKEIRRLVRENNRSELDEDVIICQIYMESRFDSNAQGEGSSARGLMQLLRAPVRELERIKNLKKPKVERLSEAKVYANSDKFHDSADFVNDGTNIQTGTEYLQLLVDREVAKGASDAVSEAYKDYRGIRNGIYYKKIKDAAEKLKNDPESMQILRGMVK